MECITLQVQSEENKLGISLLYNFLYPFVSLLHTSSHIRISVDEWLSLHDIRDFHQSLHTNAGIQMFAPTFLPLLNLLHHTASYSIPYNFTSCYLNEYARRQTSRTAARSPQKQYYCMTSQDGRSLSHMLLI
jgi:hypothetical protein